MLLCTKDLYLPISLTTLINVKSSLTRIPSSGKCQPYSSFTFTICFFTSVPWAETNHIITEPRHEKTCPGFVTRVDSNRPAQLQRVDSLENLDIETRDIILSRQRTIEVLISLRWCAGWSAHLFFAYGINRFSHDVAHIRHVIRKPVTEMVPPGKTKTGLLSYRRSLEAWNLENSIYNY